MVLGGPDTQRQYEHAQTVFSIDQPSLLMTPDSLDTHPVPLYMHSVNVYSTMRTCTLHSKRSDLGFSNMRRALSPQINDVTGADTSFPPPRNLGETVSLFDFTRSVALRLQASESAYWASLAPRGAPIVHFPSLIPLLSSQRDAMFAVDNTTLVCPPCRTKTWTSSARATVSSTGSHACVGDAVRFRGLRREIEHV